MSKNPFRPGQGWRAALLHGFTREHASRRRRRTLLLDSLENRLAPAVAGNLYVVGTTLVYNGNFADNNITVYGSDSGLTLTDTAGTISSSVPGFSGGGTSTVTGAVPSYIQTIAINGQNGTDVITIGGGAGPSGLTTTRNLIVTGTTINNADAVKAKNVTETGTLVSLNAGIATNGAGPLGGSLLINGTIDVTATTTVTLNTTSTLDGNITLNGSVVGSDGLTLNAGTGGNVSVTGAINLGGSSALSVTGDTVGLHQIIDGGATSITGQQAVNLNGSLVTTGTVAITANNGGSGPYGFTQVAGDITTTSHIGSATPDVAITVGGSGSATINDITTGAGGEVTFVVGGAIVDGNGTGAQNVNTGSGGTVAAQAGTGGINLDTSTSNLAAIVPSGGQAGSIDIRNTGFALTVTTVTIPGTPPVPVTGVATSNGNVSVSNNLTLTVGNSVVAGGAGNSVTLTTTDPNATHTDTNGNIAISASIGNGGDTVNLNATGDITMSTGTINATALNIDAGTATPSSPASGSVGAFGAPLNVSGPSGSPIVVTVTTTDASATTTSGIWITDSGSPLTIAQATAQKGVINISTTGGNNLVVAGNVATAANVTTSNLGTVTLKSGQDLTLSSGSVTSDSGLITLAQADNLTVASGVTVSTGGDISTTAPSASTIIDIAGTLAADTVTIHGTGTGSTTLSVSGMIASGNGGNTIDLGGAGSATVMLGGTLSTTGSTSVILDGPTILTSTSAISSAGTGLTIDASGAAGAVVMNIGGSITDESAGLSPTGVTIDGANGHASVINLTGTISSTTAVAVNGGTGAALDLSTTGSITGPTVTITGGAASNTLSIGGSLTATAGAITINNAAAAASSIVVSGTTSGTASTSIVTSATGDNLVVTPSLSTGFAFTFTNGSANTLEINTALANIVQSTTTFTGGSPAKTIVFTGGFKNWTNATTGTGTVTVTPTVP